MKTVSWNQQLLRYRERGCGERVIVLVHNAGSDHRVWDPVAERLSESWRVVQPDLPGFGASDRPRMAYGLQTFADALNAVIDAVAPGRAVTLVGSCVGAAAAWRVASQHPERVEGLVLVHPATWSSVGAGPVGTLYRTLAPRPRARAVVRSLLERCGEVGLVRRVALWWMASPSLPARGRRAVEEAVRRADTFRVLEAVLVALPSFEVLDQFEAPAGFPPTILVWGAANPIVPVVTLGALVSRLQPVAVLELEGTGHFAPLERSAELAAAIGRLPRDVRAT